MFLPYNFFLQRLSFQSANMTFLFSHLDYTCVCVRERECYMYISGFVVVVQLLSCLTFLRHHRLQPTRLLYPWNPPGKNTGVGYHALLHGIFPTQGSNPHLLNCKRILFISEPLRKPVCIRQTSLHIFIDCIHLLYNVIHRFLFLFFF